MLSALVANPSVQMVTHAANWRQVNMAVVLFLKLFAVVMGSIAALMDTPVMFQMGRVAEEANLYQC